jgi:hypothetical protein
MFRYLVIFFLILTTTPLVGQNSTAGACKEINNPASNLEFGNQWQEYIQYTRPGNAPVLVKGGLNSSLSVSNTLVFNAAGSFNNGGVTVTSPATGYRVCGEYVLPTFEGEIRAIHTLRRNFIKGFYKITLTTQGDGMTGLSCFYGVGANPTIPLTTALSNLNTSINGLNNVLTINNSPRLLERIVYLEGEMNFVVFGVGRLTSIDPNVTANTRYNSLNCGITPLSALEQTCEQYIPVVDKEKSICGLGTLNMEVLDKESDYFFFYKKTATEPYQIYPGILKPNISRIINIPQIPYDGTNIPVWGVIRSVDGCTFYENSKPIVFEDGRFQINAASVIPPAQCGSQTAQLRIPISPLVSTGQIRTGDYEIVLSGTTGSTPSFLKSVVELSATNDFVVSNIPLNFVVNKITITHTTTRCSASSSSSYSFQPSTLPNITITKNNNPEACNTTLTLAGIDAFPCGKIVWYKREATASQDEQIATSLSITVAPIVNTTYKAKFYLYDRVFEPTPITIGAIVAPVIYDIAFSSNPFINNNTNLSILPLSNVDISTCACQYDIIDVNDNNNSFTLTTCDPQVTFGSSGNYIVNLTLNDGNCYVKTSKTLAVIDPTNPTFQPSNPVVNTAIFTTTKTSLDEAYFIKNPVGGTILYFQYNQQYLPISSNNEIQARLYDWQRNIVAYTEIPRQHGMQGYALPIPDDIAQISGAFVLELTDDNGWMQKFRVKQRINNFSCGAISPQEDEYCLLSNKGFTLHDIVGGQAPYQVKWSLRNGNSIIEEKTINTQASFCTYIPTANSLNVGTYVLEVRVTDACGAVCDNAKNFRVTGNCREAKKSVGEEVPKVEIKINVLPQNPTNPSTPIIKN